ncbi:hypothetical protein GCM10008066_04150 [Oxalicibacterium faecigallinarum]|uniref:Uncharacterized protein n=1 Tax=Oxalicibacterium faecigallinarum TaxID=573741 RepID=A0A8J3F491_9BURK|nr:hypothetical protein GCM10008066_04150 [Oxalicibacterium faecigallinarum]
MVSTPTNPCEESGFDALSITYSFVIKQTLIANARTNATERLSRKAIVKIYFFTKSFKLALCVSEKVAIRSLHITLITGALASEVMSKLL